MNLRSSAPPNFHLSQPQGLGPVTTGIESLIRILLGPSLKWHSLVDKSLPLAHFLSDRFGPDRHSYYARSRYPPPFSNAPDTSLGTHGHTRNLLPASKDQLQKLPYLLHDSIQFYKPWSDPTRGSRVAARASSNKARVGTRLWTTRDLAVDHETEHARIFHNNKKRGCVCAREKIT